MMFNTDSSLCQAWRSERIETTCFTCSVWKRIRLSIRKGHKEWVIGSLVSCVSTGNLQPTGSSALESLVAWMHSFHSFLFAISKHLDCICVDSRALKLRWEANILLGVLFIFIALMVVQMKSSYCSGHVIRKDDSYIWPFAYQHMHVCWVGIPLGSYG